MPKWIFYSLIALSVLLLIAMVYFILKIYFKNRKSNKANAKKNSPRNSADNITTIVLHPKETSSDSAPNSTSSARTDPPSLNVELFHSQIIGTRSSQQDSMGWRSSAEKGILAVVCDGMGGLSNGDEASLICTNTILSDFDGLTNAISDYSQFFNNAVSKSDIAIVQTLRSNEDDRSGTTVVSAIINNDKLFWTSIGDSRIYLYRNKTLRCLTRDHNYWIELEQKVKEKTITLEDALADPEREALISFVGMNGIEIIDTESQGMPLEENDVILLCTDGLYKTLEDNEIAKIIDAHLYIPNYIPGVLTAAANDKAFVHQDNASVIVLFCKRPKHI